VKQWKRGLEELSKSIQLWSLGQIAWGKADHFTRECRERAADIFRNQPQLTIPERNHLLEIILQATHLGTQLRRNR
jgi:hypothetical protein